MEKLTKERLTKWQGLTVGQLKDFIEKFHVPDTALVMIERVEDIYFEGVDISGMRGCDVTEDGIFPPGSKSNGWGVYLKEG